MTVKAYGNWRNNAEMIADVAKLGYLDGRVMDLTYGEGNFWTVFHPPRRKFVAHDLYTLDGVDATEPLPHRKLSFNAIVIDFPYAFRGRASKDFDGKYGVDEYEPAHVIMERIFAGMTQAAVCLAHEGYLLVKCQDQVVSGHVRWQTDEITKHGEVLRLRKEDRFDIPSGRPQPEGRMKRCPDCKGHGNFGPRAVRIDPCLTCDATGCIPSEQQHAGYRPSTLLVFQKPKARKRR